MGMWKSNERARPCLSAGRQKTPLIVMSYLKAQWLVHSFIPDIFKVLTFSKRLLAPPLSPPPPAKNLGVHQHPQAGSRYTVLQLWAHFTWLYVGAHSAAMLFLSQATTVKLIWPSQDQTLCHSTLQGCWPIFIYVYSISHHLDSGEFKPCIWGFFNLVKKKIIFKWAINHAYTLYSFQPRTY